MWYFWLILISLFFTFLFIRFFSKIAYIFGILMALIFIGLIMIPINPEIGIQVTVYSFGLLAILVIVFFFSGLISTFLVAPLMLLWGSIKGLFK